MKRSLKVTLVGVLALAGVSMATAETQAMPIQPLQSTASAAGNIEHIWWRGGYGWRGYGWRRPFIGYGYGWRRPFIGYGYGWRRPWGYGWRRHWGWRRW